ncbi:MAG: PEP-CTERM sorting domain-containing protein [Tepidisphaeraceae bacterium]
MKRFLTVFSVVSMVGLFLACTGGVRANLIIVIPNYTFQTPDVPNDGVTDNRVDLDAVPDWTFTSSENGIIAAGVWDPVNADYGGSNGDNAALPGTAQGGQAAYVYLEQFNDLDPQPLGGILTSNTALVTIEPLTRYDLTVAIGNAKSFNPGEVTIQEILVDGEVVASEFTDESTLPNNTFTDVTTSFTTTIDDPLIGGQLRIRLIHTHAGTGIREVEFDNIRLMTTTVPEPTSAALTLLCAAAMTARRRREPAI